MFDFEAGTIVHMDFICGFFQGQASGMDGTLTLIFAIAETIRDSKKFIKEY